MKSIGAGLLLSVLSAGCLESGPTSPGLEARLIGLFGGQEVGDVLELRGSEAGTIYLPAGAAGNQFVYIPFFVADEGEARLRIRVAGENVTGASSGVSRARLPEALADLGIRAPLVRDDAYHLRLLEWQRGELRRRARHPGWQGSRNRVVREMQASARAVPQVGEVIPLRVSNPASANLCNNPLIRQGRVAAVTDKAIVVMDTLDPQLSNAELQRIGREFDQLVWPLNLRNFGEPTDLDQNGRVIIFFTSVVNQIGAGGFFFGGDLFPRGPGVALPPSSVGSFTCSASNQGEIFYILVPDQDYSAAEVAELATGVVGHEFQHLINFSRRLYVTRTQEDEEVWLNEGLSHIAEELLFYQASPFEPRQNIDIEGLRRTQESINAFRRYGFQNLARYELYLQNPDEESLMAADDSLETRGATWAFLRYVADHDERADDAFFRALVNSRTSGLANLRAVLNADPIDWMQRWTISVYADDFVEGIDDRYQQPSWNFRSVISFLNNGRFPLKVSTLTGTGAVDVNLKGGGSAFIEANTGGGRAAVLTTTTGGATPPADLRVSVIRTR